MSKKISGCGQRHLKLQTSCFCPSVIVPNCSLALIFVHNLVAYSNDYLLVVISNLLKPQNPDKLSFVPYLAIVLSLFYD